MTSLRGAPISIFSNHPYLEFYMRYASLKDIFMCAVLVLAFNKIGAASPREIDTKHDRSVGKHQSESFYISGAGGWVVGWLLCCYKALIKSHL